MTEHEFQKIKKNNIAFFSLISMALAIVVAKLAIIIGLIWIAYHFISKFW